MDAQTTFCPATRWLTCLRRFRKHTRNIQFCMHSVLVVFKFSQGRVHYNSPHNKNKYIIFPHYILGIYCGSDHMQYIIITRTNEQQTHTHTQIQTHWLRYMYSILIKLIYRKSVLIIRADHQYTWYMYKHTQMQASMSHR